ncbi:MAG: hypothetical protein ACLU4W_02245 [Acutalibacteraceae bacterium]
MPELAEQLPTKELLSALGLAVVECEGCEADDILGMLSAQWCTVPPCQRTGFRSLWENA